MKPRMTDRIEQLLKTDSAMEFFLILAGSLPGEIARAYDQEHGFGMKLSVQQNLTWLDGDTHMIGLKTTRSFVLYQDAILTWTMLGQPTITGLKAIQETLAKHLEALQHFFLPAQSA